MLKALVCKLGIVGMFAAALMLVVPPSVPQAATGFPGSLYYGTGQTSPSKTRNRFTAQHYGDVNDVDWGPGGPEQYAKTHYGYDLRGRDRYGNNIVDWALTIIGGLGGCIGPAAACAAARFDAPSIITCCMYGAMGAMVILNVSRYPDRPWQVSTRNGVTHRTTTYEKAMRELQQMYYEWEK